MRPRYYTILSHIATWGVLFLLPTIFRPLEYPVTLIPTAAVIVLFYVNYIWLAPLHPGVVRHSGYHQPSLSTSSHLYIYT